MLLLYSSYEEASSFFIVALVMALCAGLFRLARFNTISTKNKDDFFKGLPTTISAMFIASLVYYRATLSSGIFAPLLEEQWLGMTVLLLAFLMISPIHFPSFKKRSLHAVIFRFLLFLTGALVLLSLFCNIPVFFIATFTYILSGPVVGLLNYAKRLRA
jgi:phosphatidylserine synthase